MLKKVILACLIAATFCPFAGEAQLLNKIKNAVEQKKLDKSSTDEVAAGLKEALTTGIKNGATRVSAPNGYFKDAAIKILMPPDAKTVESKMRAIGMGQKVDDAILSMNRAAEKAAIKSIPIFQDAISKMSFSDAMGILHGSKNAATEYLMRTTGGALTNSFKPTIQEALDQVGATKYWAEVFNTYNKLPFVQNINPNLTEYVTQKAIEGLFAQVAIEEAKIRTDPAAQVTDLLKKVFGG